MSEAHRIYKSLSTEQLEVLAKKKLDARYKIKDWLDLLQKVAIYDRFADARRKSLFGWSVGLYIASAILPVIFMATSLLFLLFIPVITLVVAITYSIKVSNLKKKDLNNGMRNFLVPWLVALHEEAGKNAYAKIKMSLDNPINKDYLMDEFKSKESGYPKITTQIYFYPWLDGEVTFPDGTQIDWKCEQTIRKRRIVKRNPRGKIKTKTKYKIKHSVVAKVQMPVSVYSLKPETKADIFMKEGEFFVFKSKLKSISTDLEETSQINTLLQLIAKAYQSVNVLPLAS